MTNYKHLHHKGLHWYHYDQALTQEDQKFLISQFRFNQDDLDDCHSQKSRRPKIRRYKNYTYLIFHIPYKPSRSDHFAICELNVFITRNSLVTIESIGNIPALNFYLKRTLKSKKAIQSRFSSGSAGLFSKLVINILDDLHQLIDTQGDQIDKLQQEVFKKHFAKRFIETVSIIRYNQIVTQNSLERQLHIFDQFRGEENPLSRFSINGKNNWSKTIESLQSALYEVESDIDHLEGLVTTFESLVTYHTNEVIKILTVFSVLLMPLTLVSSIYGMNFIHMPLLHDPLGFIIISAIMIVIASIMTLVFKLKKWI